MKRRLLVTILIILITLSVTTNALAQDYYFSLDKEVVNAYWNTDGTLSLDYLLTFTNQPSGHSIEYVDMGMPTGNFTMSTVKADVNGKSVSVSQSDYQGNGSGFAVVLGSAAIQPGQSGTVHVYVGRVSDVLYKDDNDANYVSAVFAPVYFGSQYVTGKTDLTVTFHLPPGLQENDPRWHNAPSGFPSEPQAGFDSNNRVTYTWSNANASASREYQFGASFPKSAVPNAVIVQPQTFTPQTDVGPIFGVFILICVFGFLFIVTPILAIIAGSRRKLQYMPPRISIEGHGIKRGLTAVEAAILMEQPLDKVMTMILFGAIKKNAATVTSRDPLELSIASPLPEELRDYEINFVNAFKESNATQRRNLLREMTVKLVKSVSEKMKGFSRRETIDYYKSIMEKAWLQVEQAATPEVKGQLLDQNLEWTMLDREYDQRTRRVFTGPVFVPMWWGHYDPMWRGGGASTFGGSSTPISTGRSGSSALPGADFAASVVGGVQTFSSKVIGNVQDFTSRVTNVTNPPPPAAKAGGGYRGGGGGRSCACACACAGCACACAGGGR